jgi:hypothetical protein
MSPLQTIIHYILTYNIFKNSTFRISNMDYILSIHKCTHGYIPRMIKLFFPSDKNKLDDTLIEVNYYENQGKSSSTFSIYFIPSIL